MASAYTDIDALGIYLTSAGDGVPLSNQSASLGGYRSATELRRSGFLVTSPGIAPIRIDWIAGGNGTGAGVLTATGTSAVKWTPPGSTAGSPVTIANGETKLLEGGTASKAIRVTRETADDLTGTLSLTVLKPFATAFGFDDVSDANRTAGISQYRGLMLYNQSGASMTLIKLWIKTLGTQRTSDAGQLGGAGSGSIVTTGSFADWPMSGWCHIKDAGTTREIVYYTSRTTTTLTVPAAGRGLLGTSAAAGGATDTLDAVPGIRIGLEAPTADAIQVIADDTTAPAGITWNAQTTSAAGLAIASLGALTPYGLWIHREIPAGATAAPSLENSINLEFVYSTVTYSDNFSGIYRMADASLARYELYVGSGAAPTYTTPDATGAALPLAYVATPPGSGTTQFQFVMRYRNAYNVVSQNVYAKKGTIDSSGVLQVEPPSAPTNVSLVDSASGEVTLSAKYSGATDQTPANQWSIRARGDGVNPDGSETPVLLPMERNGFFGQPVSILTRTLGPYGKNQDLRVLLRSRIGATGTESTNTAATTITVGTKGPQSAYKPGALFYATNDYFVAGFTARTVQIDSAKGIYFTFGYGYTDFFADSALVWRLRYDSTLPNSNGLWTTFFFDQDVITGTPATDPLDIVSWTGGDKRISVVANGVRRMEIDITNSLLTCSGMDQGVLPVASTRKIDPVYNAQFRALFQVFDPSFSNYDTAIDLDYDGVMRMNVPYKQVASIADIP